VYCQELTFDEKRNDNDQRHCGSCPSRL